MARTQEYYRLGGRLPRYTTKLNTFASGMYLTDQTIPEGYAKIMVNYDIDDTGSHIKPRRGREVVQNIPYTNRLGTLGPITLTDYIYSYHDVEYNGRTIEEVLDTQDVAMSHGILPAVDVDPINSEIYERSGLLDLDLFISSMKYTKLLAGGGTATKHIAPFWFLVYDKETESFKRLDQDPTTVIGGFTARVVRNAYAFDKQVLAAAKHRLGKPISAILNNELIAFTYDPIEYEEDDNLGTSQLILSPVSLTKLKVKDGTLKRENITPQELTPAEAYTSGFNLLHDTPYTFNDNIGGGSLFVLGVIPQINGHINLSPDIGTPFDLRVYYQKGLNDTGVKYKVEVADANRTDAGYNTVIDWASATAIDNGTEFIISNCQFNLAAAYIRVTIRIGEDTTTEAAGTIYLNQNNAALKNLDFRSYNLASAKGMVAWQGCLGLYGFTDAPDTLLFSDVENPAYFPFPQNVLTFDNEILAVHNYLENLIVVTVDSVWIVTPGTSIATSIQKKVLDNVHIPEIDALNLVVLKDQIFFKTDTQFYVLKPNTYVADKTNLKNYVNSTAIANFTKNFTSETVKLLNKVYPLMWQDVSNSTKAHRYFADFDVLDIHGETREEEVHYIYKIRPKYNDGSYTLDHVNLHLVYNTLARTWRLYLVSIGDATTSYNPILYRNKQSGYFYEFFPHTLNDEDCGITITKQTYDVVSDQVTVGDWKLLDENSYNNYPYLDTGVVELDDAFTKRFREVQFGLLNQEKTTIRFYSKFFLDGKEVVHATKYQMQHITDPEAEDYGSVYVTPLEFENMALYGMSTLADNVEERDYWRLDLSRFPDLANVTVRFELQGRGRRGSLQLLNTSLQRYQLSDLNWVYRIMSAR